MFKNNRELYWLSLALYFSFSFKPKWNISLNKFHFFLSKILIYFSLYVITDISDWRWMFELSFFKPEHSTFNIYVLKLMINKLYFTVYVTLKRNFLNQKFWCPCGLWELNGLIHIRPPLKGLKKFRHKLKLYYKKIKLYHLSNFKNANCKKNLPFLYFFNHS